MGLSDMFIVLGIFVGAFAATMIWFLIQYLTPIMAAVAGYGLGVRLGMLTLGEEFGVVVFLLALLGAGAGLFVYLLILVIARELKQTYGRKRLFGWLLEIGIVVGPLLMIINTAVYQGYLGPEGWSGASLPDRVNFIALALMLSAFFGAITMSRHERHMREAEAQS